MAANANGKVKHSSAVVFDKAAFIKKYPTFYEKIAAPVRAETKEERQSWVVRITPHAPFFATNFFFSGEHYC